MLVAFNNGKLARTLRIGVADTPLQPIPAITALFGEGTAERNANDLRLTLPPQSITIFNMY